MAICKAFVERLQEAGYFTGLYINNNWLYALLDTEWVKENLDVWYARYTADPVEESGRLDWEFSDIPWKDGTASMPGELDKRYGMWQYTKKGQINGGSMNFDFNYAYKDYASIMAQWGLNGF